MRGIRKLLVVFGAFGSLIVGACVIRDVGIFVAYAGAVVGAGGWFFKSNVEAHKALSDKES